MVLAVREIMQLLVNVKLDIAGAEITKQSPSTMLATCLETE